MEVVKSYPDPRTCLQLAFHDCQNLGSTTAMLLLLHKNTLHPCNLGDCAYLFYERLSSASLSLTVALSYLHCVRCSWGSISLIGPPPADGQHAPGSRRRSFRKPKRCAMFDGLSASNFSG